MGSAVLRQMEREAKESTSFARPSTPALVITALGIGGLILSLLGKGYKPPSQ